MPANLTGLPGDGPDRKRRAASGVAVELRQYDAVDSERVVEGGGRR